MTAADVFETAVVLAALLLGLKLRYDDKAAIRKQDATQATAERTFRKDMAKLNGGEQS